MGQSTPVGAVMVVGGGIAGMQASLDLADQGFKVYLVERESAIGGKMAQLDKTFPTNDCAMCTISPKLVDTGRHPNIEILTNSEVLEVRGEVGSFEARLICQPRYVDASKCVACNDCVEVCPVIVPDTFNQGLAERRAAYKLYPQAVPNAYAIQKRGIAPCRDACPAGQRAQGYIALIREGRWEDALRVIKMDNPFPGICGRICNHRCETACNRGMVDEPINIRALKRFVTDKVYETPRTTREPAEIRSEKRVAIIGAGPCGLTAAQDLITSGYGVTIFEAMPVAGGMLRLGVPEYRLPTEIIEREVQDILDLGVELRLNHRVDNLDDLFRAGYEAVLVAVGAHEGVRLPIPGSRLNGVIINTQFLRDVRLGAYERNFRGQVLYRGDQVIGPRVLVLGGGNVAIDCARTAVRLGLDVHLACLESRDEMPAHAWEVDAAEVEGVHLYPGRSFEQILDDGTGSVRAVECQDVAAFRFDDAGRLHVEKVPGSTHEISCDTVIFSVGQRAGLAFIPKDAGVGITDLQTIAVNPNTLAASRPGVFAAGDSVSGTAFVIEAVASGHQVAESIRRYLEGEPVEPPARPDLPVVQLSRRELGDRLASGEIQPEPRVPMPERPVAARIGGFSEVELGYDDASARKEAARCLACGICSECMSCVFACGVNAIDHDMAPVEKSLDVGAIILAPGYQTYQAERSAEFGLGRYPNVVTALQFERLLSASGPTLGHLKRPSDGRTPARIAFLQCIGSRDQNHDYCSAVCCMFATKEAVIAKEHHPELDIHVFMLDMRAFSKGFWRYYEQARDRYGIRFTRCRISGLKQDSDTGDLIVAYADEDHRLGQERFDLVVLSVGMEIAPGVRSLGARLGIELDPYGFCRTERFNPLETSREGIFSIGPFREPKDIPESVVEASGAAAAVASLLAPARHSLTEKTKYPPERQIGEEAPRVGVFVCHCGSNIGGYLDVPEVTAYAAGLPHVTHAEANLYTCSQDSIGHISEQVKLLSLNRVVVASCTPLTHEPLFRDSLRMAGLNPYLFEMANIRNQCSWVHSQDREAATHKAKDLVRMAVARAALLSPQSTLEVAVRKSALVVGGGVAGMTAALSLADQGFGVDLVEKASDLGGNLTHVSRLEGGRSPRAVLERLVREVWDSDHITVHLDSEVVTSSGFKGNFTTRVRHCSGAITEVSHGATILAIGGREYRGPDYGYGEHPSIITQQELEALLDDPHGAVAGLNSVAMIQCVGPAEQYCSRICCTVALKNAVALKKLRPEMQVLVLYRDIRTYGFKERLYSRARELGVLFVRYDPEQKPVVRQEVWGLEIEVTDLALGRSLELSPDLLVLSMPVIPQPDAGKLAGIFKVPLDSDGFFLEAHVKLRPVDFPSEGVFMAGMAHYPKLLDEAQIQAQAAAARAGRVLSQDSLLAGGRVAVVDAAACTGCLTCVRICPFSVPKIQADLTGAGGILGAAYIEAAVCQGCGSCVSECPAQAIELMHYTDAQMRAKVFGLLRTQPGFVPLELVEVADQ